MASAHPRRLVALLLGLTLIPLAVLLWLGWRLVAQDRTIEQTRQRERVERSADLLVAALQRPIGASGERLAAGAKDWPDGVVALTFLLNRVEASPAGRLAYLPVVTTQQEPAAATFAQAEELEYRKKDPAAAIAAYRRLTQSPEVPVRASALLRLARNLANAGKTDEALATYARIVNIDGASEAQVPVGLIARYARCRLFEDRKREAELRSEAVMLEGELASSRWELSGPVYAVYAADAERWSATRSERRRESEAFAEAAARLWEDRRSPAGPRSGSGRFSLTVQGRVFTVLSQSSAESDRVLIASLAFVAKAWLEPAAAATRDQKIAIGLRGPHNEPLLAWPPATGAGALVNRLTESRTALQAELPWSVVVTDVDVEGDDTLASRRGLLIAGFAMLVGMALGAGYLITRAVSREMAVARLQSDFVAAVSHEFRTPLTTLRQFTEMLREQPDLPDERRRVCYDAQARATDRLTRLVESVLDFGRMEAGARPYRLEARDCADLIRSVVNDFRTQPHVSGHQIDFQHSGSSWIAVDDEALSRAVWNLLDNAVKYSPEPSPIEVRLDRQDEAVVIAVRDRGIGVPVHERDVIFGNFQRGEQARVRGIKGTGIGLAMVAQIVKAHGGRVEVHSDAGTGSTFTIRLPAAVQGQTPTRK